MAFWEAVRTTFAEIWGHKMRSGLTLVGVVLGTLAVVVMVTMIEAIKVMVWEGIKGLGYDGVMFVSQRAPQTPLERKKVQFSRGLAVSDVNDLARWGDYDAVAAMSALDTVIKGRGEERRVRVYGVTPSYAFVRNRTVSAGRFFDGRDQQARRRVAVLGAELATSLFGSDDPIGRQVRLGEAVFEVVGVESRIGNSQVNDGGSARREMNGVLVPLDAFRSYLRGGDRIALLMVKSSDDDHFSAVQAETERLVRRAHHGVGDFHVENVADEIFKAEARIREMLRNWTIVMAAIAGISLLVGGVGIYSVLKISLAERLYEIGLRKAIGASDRAILVQFLVESTSLSALGGLLGCGLGVVITRVLSGSFEAGLPLAPLGLALGIGFAVAVGLFAGIFPSLSAARMTPVEALRG